MTKQEKYAKDHLLDIKILGNLRIRLQKTKDINEWKEIKSIIKIFKGKNFNIWQKERDYEKSFTSQIREIQKR